MANTSIGTLITAALDNASRSATGTTRSTQTMTDACIERIYWVMAEMARKHDFSELKATSSSVAGTSITVDGTATYTLPTNWKTIYSIRIIDGTESRKLKPIIQRKKDREAPYPAGDLESHPNFYTIYGNSFDVYPIPGTAYVMPIRYAAWPTKPTTTTELCSYAPDKNSLIVAGLTFHLFMYLQQYTDAAAWKAVFMQGLKEAIADDEYELDLEQVGEAFNSGYADKSGDDWLWYQQYTTIST